MEATRNKIRSQLHAAADYIEKHGWRRGGYQDMSGRVCTSMALRKVNPESDYIWDRDVYGFLAPHLGVCPEAGICHWNDRQSSGKEVVRRIRAAAEVA